MNTRVNVRLIMALLLVLAVLMSFRVGLAQDGGDDPVEQDWANLEGVGEIAKAADNFNVPVVPTPEAEEMALARRLFNSPTDFMDPQIRRRFESEKMNLSLLRTVNQKIEQVKRRMDGGGSKSKRMPLRQTPPGDILVQTTDDMSGDVLTVFTDYSVVMADAKGETFFEGYIAGESAETLMIVGQDTDGNQYAVSHGDVIGLTVGGDVFLGTGDHLYFYDYDEDGNFVSLTDSDGGEYQVESDNFGGVSITGPDGDAVQVDETGAFKLYDEAGNLVVEGELFDANNDEFAGFDASPDYGDNSSDYGSDYGDAGGDYGGDSGDASGGDDYSGGGD